MQKSIRVLYVDDEPELLELGRIFLEQAGDITVATALSARDALEQLDRESVDAVISDYQMQDSDGIDLLREIRAGMKDLPFILFTGKGGEDVVIEALNNGADYYLRKGGNTRAAFAELEEKVRQVIGVWQSGEHGYTPVQAVRDRQADRRKDMLGTLTCHDIANRLTVLRGRIRIVRRMITDPEILEEIGKMEDAGRDMCSYMETARLYQEIGNQAPRWQDVNADICHEHALLGSKPLSLVTDLRSLEIYADPLCPRVFTNLFDNTVRHGESATAVQVSVRRTAQGIAIVWEDNGIGIPTEDKDRIFSQVPGGNSGLGLSLCREILATTGITIAENGAPGKGARFEIFVPDGAFRFGAGLTPASGNQPPTCGYHP